MGGDSDALQKKASASGKGLRPAEARNIYREVKVCIDNEDYEEALKLCKKLPLDESSGSCRLFCLLQLGQYRVALDLLKSVKSIAATTAVESQQQKSGSSRHNGSGGAAPLPFAFEEAYCLYRLNQPQKALQVLQAHEQQQQQQRGGGGAAVDNGDERFVHLKAQVLHRLGNYDEAKNIYEQLLESDPENELLLVNYVSAAVCGDALRKASCPAIDRSSTSSNGRDGGRSSGNALKIPPWIQEKIAARLTSAYELPYNAACAALQEGRLGDAHELLLTAKSLCLEECGASAGGAGIGEEEEEESEEEVLQHLRVRGELAGVYVQLGFLEELRGNSERAAQLYGAVLQRLRETELPSQQHRIGGAAAEGEAGRDGAVAAAGGKAGAGEEAVEAAVAIVAQSNLLRLQQQQNAKKKKKKEPHTSLPASAAGGGAAAEAGEAAEEATVECLEDAVQRITHTATDGKDVEHKLSKSQILALAINRCISLLDAGRVDEAGRLISSSTSKFGQQHIKLTLLRASLQLPSGRLRKIEEQLLQVAAATAGGSGSSSGEPQQQQVSPLLFRLLLAIALLRLLQNNSAGAVQQLRQAQQVLQRCFKQQEQQQGEQRQPEQQQQLLKQQLQLLQELLLLQQKAGDDEGMLQTLHLQLSLYERSTSTTSNAAESRSAAAAAGEGGGGGSGAAEASLLLSAAAAYASLCCWSASFFCYMKVVESLAGAAKAVGAASRSSSSSSRSRNTLAAAGGGGSASAALLCYYWQAAAGAVDSASRLSAAEAAAAAAQLQAGTSLVAQAAAAARRRGSSSSGQTFPGDTEEEEERQKSSSSRWGRSSSSKKEEEERGCVQRSSSSSCYALLGKQLLAELKQKLPQQLHLLDGEEIERQEVGGLLLLQQRSNRGKAAAAAGPRKGSRQQQHSRSCSAAAGTAAGEQQAGSGNPKKRKERRDAEGGDPDGERNGRTTHKGGEEGSAGIKKRRKRKTRWPQGFDPSQPHLPPDPERWLPKHERAGFKKMLRRRKEAGRGGAQGATLPGTADATTGFRDYGPSTAKMEAARDINVGGRKKRAGRK